MTLGLKLLRAFSSENALTIYGRVRMKKQAPMGACPYRIQQYLRQSQCYPSHLEARLVNDISHALHLYPSLSVNVDVYLSNGGVEQRLAYLGGTVPITFRAATYNIPVRIWIMTYHPAGPPVIFVRPNHSMQLSEKHEHVDSEGQVYLPDLASWDATRSTIPDVVANMITVFSQKPPLYARRTPVPSSLSLSSEQERQHLIRIFTERTRSYLSEISKDGHAEFSALHQELDEVRKGEIALIDAEHQLSAATKQNADEVAVVRAQHTLIRQRMAKNGVTEGDLPVEKIIMTDPYTWQVVDCVARDAAFQDCLDRVSVAFGDEAIGFEKFLRETKRISRELYCIRALKLKIRKRQARLRPPGQALSALYMSSSQV